MRKFVWVSLFVVGILFGAQQNTRADVMGFVFDWEGTPGSPVINYTFSGSDVSANNFSATTLQFDIDGDPFSLGTAYLAGPLSLVGTASITNEDTAETDTITEFRIYDDFSGVNYLFFDTSTTVVATNSSQFFTVTGSGTFTLSGGKTFSDLNVGSYSATPLGGFVGVSTLNISESGPAVPEPSSIVLLGLGAVGLFVAQRRRKS